MSGVKGMKGGGGARKGAGRKPKTVSFWYTLDEYEQEFFQEACKQQGIDPSCANVLKLAKQAAREGINAAMKQVFVQYRTS